MIKIGKENNSILESCEKRSCVWSRVGDEVNEMDEIVLTAMEDRKDMDSSKET